MADVILTSFATVPFIVPCRDKRMHRRPYLPFLPSPSICQPFSASSRPSVIGRWSFHSAVLVGSYRLPFSKKKVTWMSLINSNKTRKAVHRSKGLGGNVVLISCAVLKEMDCPGSTSASQIGSSVAHPLSLNHDSIVYYYRLLRRKKKERSPVSLTKHIQTETC